MIEGQKNAFQFSREELTNVFRSYATYNGYNTVGRISPREMEENPELIGLLREAIKEHSHYITGEGPSNDGSYVIWSEGWWHW